MSNIASSPAGDANSNTLTLWNFAEHPNRTSNLGHNLPAETAIDFGCSRATRRHHVRRQTFVQSLTHSLPGIVMQAAAHLPADGRKEKCDASILDLV